MVFYILIIFKTSYWNFSLSCSLMILLTRFILRQVIWSKIS